MHASTSNVLSGWSWRKAASTEWTRCTHDRPATQIHPDLVDAGVIQDPLLGLNERDCQWVGETDWEYMCTFDASKEDLAKAHQALKFESLDTFATVWLNDQEILKSDNMFHIHHVDVGKYVREGKNEIRILFESALLKGRQLNEAFGQVKCWNGETARLGKTDEEHTHTGGPCLITCGPNKPITFFSYDAKLSYVHVLAQVASDLSAEVDVAIKVTGQTQGLRADVEILLDGRVLQKTRVDLRLDSKAHFKLDQPQLWYPHRYGEATLHTVRVTLFHNDETLDSWSKEVGFRRAELVQQPLEGQSGKSFFFRINNIPIYCCGSNWIPAHSFESRLEDSDYKEWVDLIVSGNQDMLRIWGGGYYEDERLLAECDRRGLLVWHDFMFGCGQYPCNKEIEASVKQEAEDQLKRLRNFCSIVIWAGNNEDYQMAEEQNLTWEKDDLSGDYNHTNFPARTLYEKVLPDAVKQFSPLTAYHPGSPWGGKTTRDQTEGDIHQWDVWHGSQEPYQQWNRLGGRFVSEFGMQGLPSIHTIDYLLDGNDEDRYPQSETIEHHNKADSWERRLGLYTMENIKVPSLDMQDWVYATQLLQAECLGQAYSVWRRDWKGPSREYAAGALVWQINDCWACTSWAISDFFKRPKLAYYAIKRESASKVLGIHREADKYDLWVCNATLADLSGTLEWSTFDIATGRQLSAESKNICVKPNQATDLLNEVSLGSRSRSTIVYARLVDANGQLICRAVNWPEPLKHLHFPSRKVSLKVDVQAGTVSLSSNKPIKGVELDVAAVDRVFFHDNGIDLVPGETVTIGVSGLKASDEVFHRFYCDHEAQRLQNGK